MVGTKSTCKNRWRQLPFDFGRIAVKHLVTVEPAISEPHAEQITRADEQLMLPASLHGSYSAELQRWIWSISRLVTLLAARQSPSG